MNPLYRNNEYIIYPDHYNFTYKYMYVEYDMSGEVNDYLFFSH
jgi:hypothetical protein